MPELISFAASIIAAFVAAFVAHYLATSRMRQNELSKFQMGAYSDFITSASRLAVARRLGDSSNQISDLSALNDAKSRIITSGHPEVVRALIQFWEEGATLEREGEILAYNRLVAVIRKNLGHKSHDIYDLQVSNALFKLEPSSYSFHGDKAANKSNQPGTLQSNAPV